MSEAFKLTCNNVTLLRALKAADDLEFALGEMANGRRKPGQLPLEALAVLVQFARNEAFKPEEQEKS